MFVVGGVALGVVLLSLLADPVMRYFVPRLNPRISFETDGDPAARRLDAQTMKQKHPVIFDGEDYRTEGRLREVAVLAIAAYATALDGVAARRAPQSVEQLLANVDRGWMKSVGLEALPDGSGFFSAHNTLYVRYRPQQLDVEILALPRARGDGPALLMRLPETDSFDLPPGRLRYFEAMRLEGVRVPQPFAMSPEIQATGWRSEIMDARLPTDITPEQFIRWARERAAANTTARGSQAASP